MGPVTDLQRIYHLADAFAGRIYIRPCVTDKRMEVIDIRSEEMTVCTATGRCPLHKKARAKRCTGDCEVFLPPPGGFEPACRSTACAMAGRPACDREILY